jgi:hypothetical protein
MFTNNKKSSVETKNIKVIKTPTINNDKVEIAEAKIYKIFLEVYLQNLLK